MPPRLSLRSDEKASQATTSGSHATSEDMKQLLDFALRNLALLYVPAVALVLILVLFCAS